MREAGTGHTGCDSTDGTRAGQADPQTRRLGSWWSGWGGNRSVANGNRASFGGYENILKDYSDGCTAP